MPSICSSLAGQISVKITTSDLDRAFANSLNITYILIYKDFENKDLALKYCNKFLSFQKFFLDDYVLNLNSIFLNSGYELNISENKEAIIHINNLISKDKITLQGVILAINVLGLSFGHDGGACVVTDGKLLSAIGTERLTRFKKERGVNKKTIKYVLDKAGMKLDDITEILFENEIFKNKLSFKIWIKLHFYEKKLNYR